MQKQKKKKQVQNFKEKGSANSTTTTKIFIEQGNIKKLNTRYGLGLWYTSAERSFNDNDINNN